MSESSGRPPRTDGTTDPYDPYAAPIAGSGEHAARTGAVTHDPLDTSLPYEPGLSGFGGTGRDVGSAEGTSSTDQGTSGSGGAGEKAKQTGEKAKQQASQVADDAKAKGTHVRDVAADEASNVAGEAKSQAKGLLETTRSEVSDQAAQQTKRAASGLSTLGEQLQSLASGDPQDGPAKDLAQQAADRVSAAARWMEGREPADLLQDVQRFARRRPGTFLAIAAGVGLVAGRLTRGVAADAKEQKDAKDASSGTSQPTGTSYGTGTSYDAGSAYDAGTSYDTGSSYGTTPYGAGASDDLLGGPDLGRAR